jgi:hypothetical protein
VINSVTAVPPTCRAIPAARLDVIAYPSGRSPESAFSLTV